MPYVTEGKKEREGGGKIFRNFGFYVTLIVHGNSLCMTEKSLQSWCLGLKNFNAHLKKKKIDIQNVILRAPVTQ